MEEFDYERYKVQMERVTASLKAQRDHYKAEAEKYHQLIDDIHTRCLNTSQNGEGYAMFWADVMLMMPQFEEDKELQGDEE